MGACLAAGRHFDHAHAARSNADGNVLEGVTRHILGNPFVAKDDFILAAGGQMMNRTADPEQVNSSQGKLPAAV